MHLRSWIIGLFAALAVMMTAGANAAEEQRVALVIGNDAYLHVTRLKNAVTDATAVKDELTRRGFKVIFQPNATRRQINDAFDTFVESLTPTTVAVLFYAGHGVEMEGQNYLLPVDLEPIKAGDVRNDGINMPAQLDRIARSQAKFTLAVIDACRDDPFKNTIDTNTRSLGGLTRSLQPTSTTASGLMIVYAAGNGQTALNSLGPQDKSPNGLFTREFLAAMRLPGLTVQEMMTEVKDQVISKAQSVGHRQTPALYDQSIGKFVFTPEDPEEAKRNEAARANAALEAQKQAQEAQAAKQRAELAETQLREAQAQLLQLRQQAAGQGSAPLVPAPAPATTAATPQRQALVASVKGNLEKIFAARAVNAASFENARGELARLTPAGAQGDLAGDLARWDIQVAEKLKSAKPRALSDNAAVQQYVQLIDAALTVWPASQTIVGLKASFAGEVAADAERVAQEQMTALLTGIDRAISVNKLTEDSVRQAEGLIARVKVLPSGEQLLVPVLDKAGVKVAARLRTQQPRDLADVSAVTLHANLVNATGRIWGKHPALLSYAASLNKEISTAQAEAQRVAQENSYEQFARQQRRGVAVP